MAAPEAFTAGEMLVMMGVGLAFMFAALGIGGLGNRFRWRNSVYEYVLFPMFLVGMVAVVVAPFMVGK